MKTLDQVAAKLQEMGYQVLKGKGGFFVKDQGWKSYAWAYKLTGIEPAKRAPRMVQCAWGDYATIVAINGGRI